MFGEATCLAGLGLWLRFMDGNLMGSRMKNVGILLPTMSWLPSSVKIFMPHPRTSRVVSKWPGSGPVILRRQRTLDFLPIPLRNAASVNHELSWVTSSSPQAPAAPPWTERAGIRSRLKWAKVSISWVSCSSIRPLMGVWSPKRCAVVASAIGTPGVRTASVGESTFGKGVDGLCGGACVVWHLGGM